MYWWQVAVPWLGIKAMPQQWPCRIFNFKATRELQILLLRVRSLGIPAVAQWDQWHLRHTGMQVRSRARYRGFRVQHCCSCVLSHSYSSVLIPNPGVPWVAKKNECFHFRSFFTKNSSIMPFLLLYSSPPPKHPWVCRAEPILI